ncbi:MAG: LysM peptidoglycan-binding domain-containing protein, partial [Woeseiaceae bacterium]|nr:LysM peptidoglycan-binding domain-containing protein [Woeseiaceae bacterium]
MIRPGWLLAAIVFALLAGCGSSGWQSSSDQHIVRRGETLYSIAFRYGLKAEELARWNRLGDGSLIYPGQVIRLTPSSASRPVASRPSTPRSLPPIPAQPPPDWAWPANGRINVEFGGNPGPGTGVLIDGRAGQPVYAAASGRVV